jgi:hypothetical protein
MAMAVALTVPTFTCRPGGSAGPTAPGAPRGDGARSTRPSRDAPGGGDAWTAARAPAPTGRLADVPHADTLVKRVRSYFAGRVGRRIHIQLDKPIYQPGETVWIKTWDLAARDLGAPRANRGLRYQLVSPRGAVVMRKRVRERAGMATNDFALPRGLAGGEYKLRVITFDGKRAERPVIVSRYEPPRIKKKLEFLRKAYGPGDEVTATIEAKRPTGEALGKHPLRAVIQVDGRAQKPVKLTTDPTGAGLVRFTLPQKIQRGDGLLTVMVSDGGVTESITRRIPIVLAKLRFALYPEGGALVQGLESRVYFAAHNLLGKPADVQGRVVDAQGRVVARFRSAYHGLGRFRLTPAPGQRYWAEITRPRGIAQRFALPRVAAKGCVLASYDDPDGADAALKVRVRCSAPRQVLVSALLRERLLDAAAVRVPADRPAVVHLRHPDPAINRSQGVARVTLFDEDLLPLAERLVYRNRKSQLKVTVKPARKAVQPRDPVDLTISTADAQGNPVAAEVALSVVDDTVISMADDKTGHLLSRLYLEPEVPGKVHEPNKLFDPENAKAGRGLDLLLGTRGYREFAWRRVLAPPRRVEAESATGRPGGPRGSGGRRVVRIKNNEIRIRPPQAARPPVPRARPRAPRPRGGRVGGLRVAAADKRLEARGPRRARRLRRRPRRNRGKAKRDLDEVRIAGERLRQRRRGWAKVRVFPVPEPQPGYQGPRTDFRETIYWAPRIRTGADGTAQVRFPTSDAITSFRVIAEGVGGGLAGRQEAVFESSLPFGMNVKLPVAVSAQDRLRLPLTLTNDTREPLPVTVQASFGELLRVEGDGPSGPRATARVRATAKGQQVQRTVTLKPRQRRTLYFRVRVTGTKGRTPVRFVARAGNLKDEFERKLEVEPLGFPQELSLSGELDRRVAHQVDLGQVVPGSVEAEVRLYPSPLATMVGGLEGMLREPSGCFEQTSSSNYPNVMVMSYLREHDLEKPRLTARATGLMRRGYRKLVGYEVKTKGYEWFGRAPGHEALTAYGLLEFKDMRRVYPKVSRKMMDRTATWLLSRRDGKGGFERNGRALDRFGRASKAVTDAYITYALAAGGYGDRIRRELRHQAEQARTSTDDYRLALAANALLRAPAKADGGRLRAAGRAAARRLASRQQESGAWTRADHSVTRSGGKNLQVETTSLCILALLRAGGHEDRVRRAMRWLRKNRGGHGRFGATQATVLALEAMTAYARASRKIRHPGAVRLSVRGRRAGRKAYAAGHADPIRFADLGARLRPGKNRLVLEKEGKGKLPYSVAISYRAKLPATSPQAVVALDTALDKSRVKMGETVRLTATVRNKTQQGQPMTLVRVGFPGGLAYQRWQLKELREKGRVAFYETRAREIILYLRALKPGETRKIPLVLTAVVPGRYTAPASSAYLYYTDEHKHWTPPVRVEIGR